MRNIIFIAPPAAGKGTVSDYLVKNFNYEHISTGEILREEIKSGSLLGKELDSIISQGKLVSDQYMIKLISDKLKSIKDKAFILDGFPRTLNQAESLDKMLVSNNITNTIVIYLDVDFDTLLKRVLGRIICPKCKRSYNKFNEELKPLKNNICDDCGVELETRSDDTEETFKVRFDSFLESTEPIVEYYQNKGILKRIDAMVALEEIFDKIKNEAKND